jgi:hypothetical protein
LEEKCHDWKFGGKFNKSMTTQNKSITLEVLIIETFPRTSLPK